MRKLILLFALVLTVCSSVMAQERFITNETEEGTICILDGSEAMVVDLGGTIGKVAIAMGNEGATNDNPYGGNSVWNENYDQSNIVLQNNWYIPTIEELAALKDMLQPNSDNTGYECQVGGSVLSLPGYPYEMGPGTMYVGKYLSSSKQYDAYHSLAFYFMGTKNNIQVGDNRGSQYPSTIRAFHKLPSINDYWLYYTTFSKKIANPSMDFYENIRSNTIDENGNGVITFKGELSSIGYGAFKDCGDLVSITIPFTVKMIGNEAFRGCSILGYVYFVDSCPTFGSNVFDDNVVFIVPDKYIDDYKQALNTDRVHGNSPEYLSNFKALSLADIVAAMGDNNGSSYLNNLVAEEIAAIKNATKIEEIIAAKNTALSKLEDVKSRYDIYKEVAEIELGSFITKQNGPVTEVTGADGQTVKLYKMKNVKFSNVNDK